jgi:type I restriction enzyme S subunit
LVINQDLKAFYSDEPFLNEWLALFLRMSGQRILADSRRDGTTVQSIQYPLLKETMLPVAPAEMRQKILQAVALIDQKRQRAADHLAAARRAIHRSRLAVLAAASSGRLTADWRMERRMPPWEKARAADACEKVQSGSTPKEWHDAEDGIPFLKVYNIIDQRLNFDYRPQFISRELFRGRFARTEARPGDVLMNIVGPPLGKVAKVTDEFPQWSINQALTLFRPSARVSTDWLYIYLCSGVSVAEVLSDTRGTVGQINISLTQCRNFEIPVPSMAEQCEIARRVTLLIDRLEIIERRIDVAARRLDLTAPSVLSKAFRGELVS